MKTINEFLGFGNKSRLQKIIDVLEVDHWNELGVNGQSAISTLIAAIDYIEDDYERFSKYKNTENAVRDAVNGALDIGNYKKSLKFE